MGGGGGRRAGTYGPLPTFRYKKTRHDAVSITFELDEYRMVNLHSVVQDVATQNRTMRAIVKPKRYL